VAVTTAVVADAAGIAAWIDSAAVVLWFCARQDVVQMTVVQVLLSALEPAVQSQQTSTASLWSPITDDI